MSDTVTDAKGRTLKLREMNPAVLLQLAEAAGDASTNAGFMRIAAICVLVDEIDGVPVAWPHKKAELYDLAKLVGNEGLAAISGYAAGGMQDVDKAKN